MNPQDIEQLKARAEAAEARSARLNELIDEARGKATEWLNRAAADIARDLAKSIILEYHEHIHGIAADVLANRIADRIWRQMTGQPCDWEQEVTSERETAR